MLNQSTVSICREHLNKELKNIERILLGLQKAKQGISVLDPNMRIGYNRRVFLEIDNRIKSQKDRRSKVENAIRDLKYNMEGRKQS